MELKCCDLFEMKINCLLNEDLNDKSKIEETLKYIKSKEVQDSLSHDPLHRSRLEIKIQTALGNFDAVGEKAAEILDTINADSIDEWKLAVKYYQDIENLIKKHNDGKLRGPQLAQIEHFINQKKFASISLIKELILIFH